MFDAVNCVMKIVNRPMWSQEVSISNLDDTFQEVQHARASQVFQRVYCQMTNAASWNRNESERVLQDIDGLDG